MARLDTKLESEGAEFLVLGHLLIEGIQAFKAYTNFPGYDLIATGKDARRNCRIQVKSRWATNWGRGFPIKNFDCDFVVVVALNRGYRYRPRSHNANDGRRPPDYYVFPVEIVRAAMDTRSSWSKALLNRMENPDQYLDAWHLVRNALEAARPSRSRRSGS